jgi:hypothetical protein
LDKKIKKPPMRISIPPDIRSTIFPIFVGGKMAENKTIDPRSVQKTPMILKGEKVFFVMYFFVQKIKYRII